LISAATDDLRFVQMLLKGPKGRRCAFSKAVVLFLHDQPADLQYLARREAEWGEGKTLTVPPISSPVPLSGAVCLLTTGAPIRVRPWKFRYTPKRSIAIVVAGNSASSLASEMTDDTPRS
jgi:hypothetical protein